MVRLAALSWDDGGAMLFCPGFSGEVHSVYRRALNIRGPGRELFSLVAAEMDNAPNTVRVALPGGLLFQPAASPGAAVSSDGLELFVGAGIVVTGAGACRWDGGLPSFPGDGFPALAANLAALRAVLAEKEGDLSGRIPPGAGRAAAELERQLAFRADMMIRALAAADFAGALEYGHSLLGLGRGQTPAGDDLLAGMFCVFQMPAGPFGPRYRALARSLVAAAAERTGDISCAMLAAAANGKTREGVVRLLAEMARGGPETVAGAAFKVMAQGASSGADTAAGVAAAWELALGLFDKQARGDANDG